MLEIQFTSSSNKLFLEYYSKIYSTGKKEIGNEVEARDNKIEQTVPH